MSRHRDKQDSSSAQAHGVGGETEMSAGAITDVDMSQYSPEAVEAIQQLRAERDEAAAARLRALADFKNYQRRAIENENRAASSAKMQMIRALLPVLDQFELASQQNVSQMTVDQLAAGMNILQQELNKAMQSAGLRQIEPKPGDEFNPQEHEAIMHQPNAEVPPGSVVIAYQTGYALGDMILRPAKVIVASSAAEQD